MSTNPHSEPHLLQVQLQLKALEKYRQTILAKRAHCEEISAKIQLYDKKIKSINEAWWPLSKNKEELPQLEEKRAELVQEEIQSKELLAALEAEAEQEEAKYKQEIKAQEKQRSEALRRLQGLLIEQQRQEKDGRTYAKYAFVSLENETELNEIEWGDSTIYVAPINSDVSGQSANRYICKICHPHEELIDDAKPVISFYIEAGDIYDIINSRVAKQLFRKEFELLQKQQFNNREEAILMIGAYIEKINEEGRKYGNKKPETIALEWLRKKDMGEFRQELRVLQAEAQQLLTDLTERFAQEEERQNLAEIEAIAIKFRKRLADVKNQDEIYGWDKAFFYAIRDVKNTAVQEKLREIQKNLLKIAPYIAKFNAIKEKAQVNEDTAVTEKIQTSIFISEPMSSIDVPVEDVRFSILKIDECITETQEFITEISSLEDEEVRVLLAQTQEEAKALLLAMRGAKERKAWEQQKKANEYLDFCKSSFNSLLDTFKDPSANKQKLSEALAAYAHARCAEIQLAQKEDDKLFNAIDAELSDLQQKAEKLKVLLNQRSKLISQFQEKLDLIIIPKDGNKVLEKEAEAQVDRKFNEFFKRITAKISELENAGSNVVLVAELKQLEEEGIQKLNDLRQHARKHLNAILDKLQAKLDLITAIENEIEIEKQFDVLTQEINKAIAVNSNQMVLKGLIEFKSQAEESKNEVVKKLKSKKEDELNKKRTFAEYVFKPMPVGGEPKLLEEKVIYFSENDQCDFCIGLDSKKKRYEHNIMLSSTLKLDVQLIDPDFQRRILNELAVKGFVSYSVQQDWIFVLSNLCAALNAVKESIIDRGDSFHKELKKVGIFYDDNKKGYSVNLNEAESSISYRNYICNPDFLIAAAFDDAAAKKGQSESRNLHAEQFKFNVSPEQSPIQNQNLLKAIDEAHEFQRKDRVEKQPVLIEEDRECAKKHLSGEALARLEEAQVHIAEAKKQQRILAEACELQEKCVEALTPSVETLEKDEAVLRKQSEFEAQMKALVDEEEQIHIRIAQQLVNFLDQLNDKNDEVHRLNEKIRLEKDVREKIEKAIDTLISAHERFAIEPTFWIWISRSSRSKRLANWLDLIKKDLRDPDVKMSAIRAQIHTAIVSFNDSGDRNTALSEFEKKINALPVLDSESGKMSELLQTQGAISFAESEIMVKDLSELNKKRIADDTKLQELSSKKVALQGKMDELKPQVAAIQERRKQAQIEHDSLRRVKQLRTKSGSQQCLAEDDKVLFSNFLALLQEQKTKKEAPFVSTEDSDEAEQLKLSASVNKIARNRSIHEINMQDVLKQIKSIGESLDRADSEGHSESKSLFSSCVSFFTKAARTTYKNTFDLAHVGENIASPLHMQKSECTPSS